MPSDSCEDSSVKSIPHSATILPFMILKARDAGTPNNRWGIMHKEEKGAL